MKGFKGFYFVFVALIIGGVVRSIILYRSEGITNLVFRSAPWFAALGIVALIYFVFWFYRKNWRRK